MTVGREGRRRGGETLGGETVGGGLLDCVVGRVWRG